jgi:hypothetical protein
VGTGVTDGGSGIQGMSGYCHPWGLRPTNGPPSKEHF